MADIKSLLEEKRVFKPEKSFRRQANWKKKQVKEYRKLGAQDPGQRLDGLQLRPRLERLVDGRCVQGGTGPEESGVH